MQSNIATAPGTTNEPLNLSFNQENIQYEAAEQQFITLLDMEDLDQSLNAYPERASYFETVLAIALADAYGEPNSDVAHLFLQRILYRINRLKLFWYDDLRHYTNERSLYLRTVRDRIETAWQQWELAQLDLSALRSLENIEQALLDRFAADVDPEPSADSLFYRDEMTESGYRRLLAIASLDGLVEASQLSRTLGGVGNEIHAVLTRLLVEEYGAGRLERKHSFHFTTMLEAMGMQTEPEAYFDIVPWEVLAIINHSFLLTECKRYFLRYIGGLLYGELSVPAAFQPYRAAGERLGLSANSMSYWTLHIKVDELHGRWMLNDVTLPLIAKYPDDAWELVLGYDQQRLLGARAGTAIAHAVRAAN